MRKRNGLTLVIVLVGALALGTLASYGAADNGKGKGKGSGSLKGKKMSSYLEVPSVSTSARGTIEAKIKNSTIEYKLTYSGLSSNASAAHFHLGQPGANGGVVAFLCGGGDKPACPATSGSVSGTIDSGDIVAVPAQGIGAGEIGEVIAAMKAGFTYANVHTSGFAGGELRGQVRPGGNGDDD